MRTLLCSSIFALIIGFETLGGKEGNRKWRLSLRILMPNGHKGKTLGKYLVDHNLDHLVPKRSSISDGEDCSPDKTKNTVHDTTSALRGRNTMPHVVTRPRRGRNALSASPVKRTSPMKKKAHEQTRRRRTKSVDSASLSSSKDRREQRQVQINVQASFPYASVGLPVVCSGTPVRVRHHNADMPRPLEQPSPPLGTWHVIRRYRHQNFFENDTDQSNMGVSDYLDYNSLDYSLPLKSNPHEHLDGDDDDDLLLHSFDLKDSEQPQ